MKSYAAFDALVAPARARRGLLRLGTGVVIIIALYLAFLLMWVVFTASVLPVEPDIGAILRGGTVLNMAILMSGFGTLILALKMVIGLLHKRDLASLVGSKALAMAQAWRVGKYCLLLAAVLFLIPFPGDGAVTQVMPLGTWVALLPLSLVLLAIQCSAEELVFRGYLQSQLAAESRSPLVWMGVPSVLFGLLHYSPEIYGDTAVLVALWATVFGAMMADITARAGTLGPAIAIHMLNNFMSLCVVGFKDELGGLALYHLPYGPGNAEVMGAMMPFEFLSMVCLWLTARIALRR
ncbi:MAG: CPBP family intramembrane glutamic endopeptidase [Shimia sp.]|uniref:CPBP family intramembrane glutamic endopeptidase n=1 Tax=Shimia sp. TaxID=1954381 RepID=UPI0040586838